MVVISYINFDMEDKKRQADLEQKEKDGSISEGERSELEQIRQGSRQSENQATQ